MLEFLFNKVAGIKATQVLPVKIARFLGTAFFNRTPLVAASVLVKLGVAL